MKLPSFQFYPADWLADSISGCSLAAQGLWLRMMILMHFSERYGYLCLNGVLVPPESIARRCGCNLEQYTTLLTELEQACVPRKTSDGIIYCKRMVEDANKRETWKEQKKEQRKDEKGENGFVHGNVRKDVHGLSNKCPPVSSSSSSVGVVKDTTPSPSGESEREETGIQKIVKGWKLLNGIPTDGPPSQAWDKVHFPRHAKGAKSLLTLFGSWEEAVKAMEYVYWGLKEKKLDCTLETIVKHSDKYREVQRL